MNTFLIDNEFRFNLKFQAANHLNLVSKTEVESRLPAMSAKQALWLAKSASFRSILKPSIDTELLRLQKLLKRHTTLVVYGSIREAQRRHLSLLFKNLVIAEEKTSLPADEMVEVLSDSNAENLAITAEVDAEGKTIVLTRGNLETLIVPFSAFQESGDGIKPDFKKVTVTDHGQTLALGDYEASIGSLLYEFDSEYRKLLKKQRAKTDKSLGACLRRIRLQKGVRQSDFSGIDPKEIGRIERGEVKSPHQTTLRKIAERLGIKVNELSEY